MSAKVLLAGLAAAGLLVFLWWLQRRERTNPEGVMLHNNIHPDDGVTTVSVGAPQSVYEARVPLSAGVLRELLVGLKHYGEAQCTIEYWAAGHKGHVVVPVGPRVVLKGMNWPVSNGDLLRVRVCADEGDRVDLSRGQVVVEARVE